MKTMDLLIVWLDFLWKIVLFVNNIITLNDVPWVTPPDTEDNKCA